MVFSNWWTEPFNARQLGLQSPKLQTYKVKTLEEDKTAPRSTVVLTKNHRLPKEHIEIKQSARSSTLFFPDRTFSLGDGMILLKHQVGKIANYIRKVIPRRRQSGPTRVFPLVVGQVDPIHHLARLATKTILDSRQANSLGDMEII